MKQPIFRNNLLSSASLMRRLSTTGLTGRPSPSETRITSFDCSSHGAHNPARGEARHVPTHRPGQTQRQAEGNLQFPKVSGAPGRHGFNCIKLADDWQGADFLAHHFDGKTTLKVQLKSRLTIDRKYSGQGLWMNFPSCGTWYLVPHDDLVDLIGQTTNWLNTTSWRERGGYSSANPSPTLLGKLRPFALEPTPEPAAATPTTFNETSPTTQKNRDARPVTPAVRGAHSGRWRHQNVGDAAEALGRAGYTCASPPIGMEETDIMARRRDESTNIRVRCPGRLHISKRRTGKDVHIVFPDQDGVWYLGPHDELVTIIGRTTPWLDSYSWWVAGAYSSGAPSHRLRDAIRHFVLPAT